MAPIASNAETLLSPTESTTSSFDMLSGHEGGRSRSSTLSMFSDDDGDDEVVLSLSSSMVWSESRLSDDEDFVLLGPARPRRHSLAVLDDNEEAPIPIISIPRPRATEFRLNTEEGDTVDGLSRAVQGLALDLTPSISHAPLISDPPNSDESSPVVNPVSSHPTLTKNQRKKARLAAAKRASADTPRPDSVTTLAPPSSPKKKKLGRKAVAAPKAVSLNGSPLGLGARSIVDDDASDELSVKDDGSTLYKAAVSYISSFLSNPTASDASNRLAFLQALIIELGIATTSLPASLKQARALLKARAFINVRDYLTLRSQGLEALQRCMHPSKNALMKDIKRRGSKASLSTIKKHGLQVFLVSCYH